MDNNYTKREIDMIHKDIDDKLNLILAQTTKHNGRLTKAASKLNELINPPKEPAKKK